MLLWSYRDASQVADQVEYFPMEMENVSDRFHFVTPYGKIKWFLIARSSAIVMLEEDGVLFC